MRYKQMTLQALVTMVSIWAGVSHAAASGAASPGLQQVDGHFAIIAQASNLFGGQRPTEMAIDIIPGDAKNIAPANFLRVIPVAIFGSSDLNVIEINPRTIRLNAVDVMLVGKSDKSLCRQTDINGDSYEDLLCDVRTTGFKVGEGEFRIIIEASTYHGESLRGEDLIRVVRN